MCGSFWVSNPSRGYVRRYSPIGRLGKRYSPEAFVVASRLRPVCSSTSLIVAPAIIPPELSLTVPVMPPNVCCANNSGAENAATAKTASSRKKGAERDRPEDIFTWPHSMKKSAAQRRSDFEDL